MALLSLLFACADEPSGPTVDIGTPIVPDEGNLYDPRLAGCDLSRTNSDGTAEDAWSFDDAGHLLSQHTVTSDGTAERDQVSTLTWDGDCLSRQEDLTTSDGNEVTSIHDATCDGRGNPARSETTTDGELLASFQIDNEYGADGSLSRRVIQLDGGAMAALDFLVEETFVWDGGWIVEQRTDETLGSTTMRDTRTAEVDSLGQVIVTAVETCTTWGAEACVAGSAATYDYDNNGNVTAGEGQETTFSYGDDEGKLNVQDSLGWTRSFTGGDHHLPATATTSTDTGTETQWQYQVVCD